ncbi:GNAT family N-acetyltransferase [Scopulibacillus cellulosilyticus]|uniref:GNAT family N-acetyltransferase n=1 Tax=Scopulibacillus cellulosilyticus TaxID=2665665 RepID=A0ABW2Q190_9BACL
MIETKRLVFKEYTMDDLDAYASLWADPEVVRYINNGETKTRQEAAQSLKNWILPSYHDGLGLFAAVLKQSGEIIGHTGLVVQDVEDRQELELGYWLARDYWGKGLAVESAKAFRDYAFNQLGLHRLISLINPNHPASIFVARKTGMTYAKTVTFNGHTALVYAIEKSSFNPNML